MFHRSALVVGVVAVVLLSTVATSAEMPSATKGKGTVRTAEEVETLRKEQVHTLHEKIPNVFDLTASNFEGLIHPHHKSKRDRFWIIAFYATWCHSCDALIQPLTELAEHIHHMDDRYHKKFLSVGKHDMTPDDSIAKHYLVSNYPTILLFHSDVKAVNHRVVEFTGELTVPNLIRFLNENSEKKLGLPPLREPSKTK